MLTYLEVCSVPLIKQKIMAIASSQARQLPSAGFDLDQKISFRGFRVDQRLNYKKAVADWCLRNARKSLDKHALEEALQWSLFSAASLEFDCQPLAFPELEHLLQDAAAQLPMPSVKWRPQPGMRKRWLHVFDEVFPYGGHTALAIRWMQMDIHNDRHSAILLNQKGPVPSPLVEAVQRTGGELWSLDAQLTLSRRAAELRQRAWEDADVVVLNINPGSIIAPVAFGVPSGPPVLFVNHGAHKFWVGGSVADLALNGRVSANERNWTIRYRGIEASRNEFLPIPLLRVDGAGHGDFRSAERRASTKAALHLPIDSKIILTVGSGYKYNPLPGLNFFEAAEAILQASPNAILLAVGPPENALWKRLNQRTGGRAFAYGIRNDVDTFHEIADVYMEGFPFGTTTALLEAAIKGIPCVLAPAIVPPPLSTDGEELDQLRRPLTVTDCVNQIVDLLENEKRRTEIGRELAVSVAKIHAEPGWITFLDTVRARIPSEHRVYRISEPAPAPRDCVDLWTSFWSRIGRSDVLTVTFRNAISVGINPKLDLPLRQALRRARRVRWPSTSQAPAILSLITWLTMLAPRRLKGRVFESLNYYLRPRGRILRMVRKWLP